MVKRGVPATGTCHVPAGVVRSTVVLCAVLAAACTPAPETTRTAASERDVATTAAGTATGAAPAAAPGQMPFDLPYALRTLFQGQREDLSRSGKRLAYTVHERPEISNGGVRYLPNGVPGGVPLSHVLVSDIDTGATARVGADAGNCWRPVFSPDERLLASYCDGGGAPHLWVHDLQRGGSRQLGTAPLKVQVWVGDEPAWSPDGKEIFVPLAAEDDVVQPDYDTDPSASSAQQAGATVIVQKSEGDAAPPSSGEAAPSSEEAPDALATTNRLYRNTHRARIAAIDVASGEHRIVVPADASPEPSVATLSPSGEWLAYISVFRSESHRQYRPFQDIAVAPSRGGAPMVVARRLVRPERTYLLGSHVWHPSRDQLFWVQDGQLWTADMAGAPLAPRRVGEVDDVVANALAVTRDGESVVVGVNALDDPAYSDPHPGAMAIVPIDGAPAKILPIPDGVTSDGMIVYPNGTLWQARSGSVALKVRDKASGQAQVLRLDADTGGAEVLWQGYANLDIVSGTPDHAGLIGRYEDAATPADLYRFDADFAGKTRISHVEPRLDGYRFESPIVFNTPIKRLDGAGDSVRSALYLPTGTKPGEPLPTLVHVYPRSTPRTGSFGGGYPATLPASVFLTRGYAVLHTELPVRPVGEVGPSVIQDIADMLTPQIRHAAALGHVDLGRLAVSGQSFGAYSTASLLAATDLFRAGVAVAGVYDLTYLYSYMGRDRGFGYPPGMIEQYWNMADLPWRDLDRYIALSPFFQAQRIRAPLLIVHGSADQAPVEDARKMYNALRLLGKTVEYAEYQGEGHVPLDWSVANAADLAERAVDFLDRHVKPHAATP